MNTTAQIKNIASKASGWLQSATSLVFRLPLIRVDRESYLRHTLGKTCTCEEVELALKTTPANTIGAKRVRQITRKEIWRHALLTSLASCLCALPSSFWMLLLLIAVDLIQFQCMVYIVLQKILFLGGYATVDTAVGERIKTYMWVSTVVMVGGHRVGDLAKSGSGAVLKQGITRMSATKGGRLFLTNVVKQVLKWTGIQLTHQQLIVGITYVVNCLCALVSGLVSFWLFMPMCHRLVRYIDENGIEEMK